jgi:rhodanese-related sulfurtransferase
MLYLFILSLIIVSGCADKKDTNLETQIIRDTTTEEAYILIQDNQDNPDFTIIDVRTPKEYATGRITNSINIDFYSKSFKDELKELDKEKKYLIYCKSGNRSGKSRNIMRKLNFTEVYNMLGGIVQWEADKLPKVK